VTGGGGGGVEGDAKGGGFFGVEEVEKGVGEAEGGGGVEAFGVGNGVADEGEVGAVDEGHAI